MIASTCQKIQQIITARKPCRGVCKSTNQWLTPLEACKLHDPIVSTCKESIRSWNREGIRLTWPEESSLAQGGRYYYQQAIMEIGTELLTDTVGTAEVGTALV